MAGSVTGFFDRGTFFVRSTIQGVRDMAREAIGSHGWKTVLGSRRGFKDQGRREGGEEASGKLPKQHLVTMDLADSAAREECAVAKGVGSKRGREDRQRGSRGLPEAIPKNAREMGWGEGEAGNERLRWALPGLVGMGFSVGLISWCVRPGAKRYGVYRREGIRWCGLCGRSTRKRVASAYLWVPRSGRSTSTAGRG